MSVKNNKSFWEEIQEKYAIGNISYMPAFYLNAGMNISFELLEKEKRPGCPQCNKPPNIHGYEEKSLIFGAINGSPLRFEFKHCRYICKVCQITFMEGFEHLPDFRSVTRDADNYIISKLGTQTFTETAAELGLSVQTIVNRALEFGSEERAQMMRGRYRYLSMDEVFISRNEKGQASYYWLLNDNSLSWKSNNIRVDKGRSKEDVVKRLQGLAYPKSVIAVSIDMWKPYRDAIAQVFPHAAIVIDPFHLIKQARSALDVIRKRAKVPPSLKSHFKKDARLFLSSLYKLSDEELDRLDSYLKADSELEKAYFIAQELSGFYQLHDYEHALNYLSLWETDVLNSGIKEMQDVLRTTVNWLPYIMNYFIHRITNGRTEGRNNLLRVIDRMGFHYGINSIQACLYAHDRKQDYLKWKKYQRRKFKELSPVV